MVSENIDFSTCHYDPTGQMFFVDHPKVGELQILDMRGFGHFKDDKTQDGIAIEINKRIRFYDALLEANKNLQAERDRYRTMLERLDKYFNSDRWHLWHLEANAQVDLVQMTREIKDALRGSDDD